MISEGYGSSSNKTFARTSFMTSIFVPQVYCDLTGH
jgi:hypothetical protein